MKKDLLEKEIQKELRKFRWQRRFLQVRILMHRQRLKFTAFSKKEMAMVHDEIEVLSTAVHRLEENVRENVFYRLYLRGV